MATKPSTTTNNGNNSIVAATLPTLTPLGSWIVRFATTSCYTCRPDYMGAASIGCIDVIN